MTRSEQITRQIQKDLPSRVIIIEQAKGKLSQQGNIDTGEAFTALRGYARRHQQQLSNTTHAVIEEHLTLDDINRNAPDG